MPNENETITASENISLKEFFLGILNERTVQWQRQFDAVNDRINITMENRKRLEETLATLVKKEEMQLWMEANDKALSKAEVATEKRFESMNEFRAQLADQQMTFARKAETDIRFDATDKKIDTAITDLRANQKILNDSLQLSVGKDKGVAVVWSLIATVLTITISAAALLFAVMNHR